MSKASIAGERVILYFCWFLLLFLPPVLLTADEGISPPAGGQTVFSQNAGLSFFLSDSLDYGESDTVPAIEVPFTQAIQVRTTQKPPNPSDLQLCGTIPTAIHKGDVLWITFWMRAGENALNPGKARMELRLAQNFTSDESLADFSAVAGDSWQQYTQVCTATRDYAPGKTEVFIRCGYDPQVLQIGGFQILNYGRSVNSSALPRSGSLATVAPAPPALGYPGMAADAPWRQAAAERIEKYRKGDLKVIVQDASGRPLAGATVRIEQLSHAFGFGSAVRAGLIEGTGQDCGRYRETIKNCYNKVVLENDLKWPNWDASAPDGHTTALAALRWLQDQGIQVRGHNLVWPSWADTPIGLISLKYDPGALEHRIEKHIRDIVGATRGQLTEWDVVNEPYYEHDVLDCLPPDAMATWFKLAHKIDPRPVLFVNDYAGFVGMEVHKDAFEKTLLSLKEQGAPIGGLGIQAHFDQNLVGPGQIVEELDRWAKLGLEIQITEFDINIKDEKLQGQYTRDFMTAVFSHPAVNALLTWGFWEGAIWRPQGALYRTDWSLKPNGQAWNDLVLKQWHTDVTGQTDAAGAISTRGFLGQYRITVTCQGQSKTWPLTLPREGAVLSATFP